jgi:hypothetical protein
VDELVEGAIRRCLIGCRPANRFKAPSVRPLSCHVTGELMLPQLVGDQHVSHRSDDRERHSNGQKEAEGKPKTTLVSTRSPRPPQHSNPTADPRRQPRAAAQGWDDRRSLDLIAVHTNPIDLPSPGRSP